MTRKNVLAFLLAAVLLAGTPAWASIKKPASVNNINKSRQDTATSTTDSGELTLGSDIKDTEASADSKPMGMPVPLGEMGPATDPLASFGPSSGTVVGNRALELRDEVLRLRSSVNLNANEFAILRANGAAGAVQYHSTVAAITARLQNGTTRGNPILLRQWDEAEASLNEVTHSLDRLNALQTSVSADASLASYLSESIKAGFQLSGAVDEDHDQLKLLRDEVSRQIVQLDYLNNQVTSDIQRQTSYLTTERSNLQTLAFAISRGELLGNSLANRPVIVSPPPVLSMPAAPRQQPAPMSAPAAAPAMPVTPAAAPAAPLPAAATFQPPLGQLGPAPMSPRDVMQETGQAAPVPSEPMPSAKPYPEPQPITDSQAGMEEKAPPSVGRLLVLIRFNQPTVEYAQQLSKAVSVALERQPNSEFSVIAVAPMSGAPGELASHQDAALRHAEDVKRSLIQLGLAPSRITVSNTQLQTAQTPEVHIYVR